MYSSANCRGLLLVRPDGWQRSDRLSRATSSLPPFKPSVSICWRCDGITFLRKKNTSLSRFFGHYWWCQVVERRQEDREGRLFPRDKGKPRPFILLSWSAC